MQYYDFALVFLLCLRVFPTNCQIIPYSLSLTSREYNDNTLTLQCMDKPGNPVPNAVFYRNGVLNTSDECFNSSVSAATNKLRFTISPECDGYYMCGARSGDGVVLSKPITIYAYPVKIGSNQNITGEVGKSITLPCDFARSPINSYTTKWFKIVSSLIDEIATYEGKIHDHTINNLQLMDEAFYRCQLRPTFPLGGFDSSNGPYLNLTVNETYKSPIITTGLIIVNNFDGSSELRVITTGSNLQYQWSINNTVVNGTTQRVVKKDEKHLKLNGRWNETLKVEYLVWNNDYSGIRHERRQVFVVSPYYIGSPIITTGLIIVNNSDGSSELRVITTGSNLQYQWSINNTVVTGATQRVVKKDERHLKLNGRWNGTLNVEYLVWNNDYSGIRHERRQVFVVNPYYIENSIVSSMLESSQVIVIIVLVMSLILNIVFCITLTVTCYKFKQSVNRSKDRFVCDSMPREQQPTYVTQLSTISNSKEIQCIRVLRQVSHGEASVTLSTQSGTIYMKHTTSDNSSTPSETKYANPMANILVEVAQTISNFEHTDMELLNGLAIILQSVTRLAQLQQCHTALRHMSIQVMEQIEHIKYNVPTATLVKHFLSDTSQPSFDIECRGLEDQSSSTTKSEVIGDETINQPLLNSVQVDDHEPQEEEEERELTKEEEEGLMKILNNMSSQLQLLTKIDPE